jgi:hypothetical protein
VAIEIETLYLKMRKSFNSAIEDSIATSFGFHPVEASHAVGEVTMDFKAPLTQDVIIQRGYRFSTLPVSGRVVYFDCSEDTLARTGDLSMRVPVRCTEGGIVGNVAPNAIRIAVTPLVYVSEVFNEETFITGKVGESKEEYKKRFNQYIETLARGTLSSIQYGCLTVPGVSGAFVEDSIGEVKVFAHDASGNLPTNLKAAIVERLIDYRPAGTEVVVLEVTKKSVNITIDATIRDGFDLDTYRTIIRDSIIAFLTNFTVSRSLTRAELITHIMSIDKSAIANAIISLATDVSAGSSELIRPGTITVNTSR